MDNPRRLVYEHCKKLLLNLLSNLCPNFENCRYAAMLIDVNASGSPNVSVPPPVDADSFWLTADGGPCRSVLYISMLYLRKS